MRKIILLITITALCHFSCFAQKKQPIKQQTSTQKTLPTKNESFEYLRTKMLAAGIYSDVTYDESECTMSFSERSDGLVYKINLSNLDENGTAWSIWTRKKDDKKFIVLDLISKNGTHGWYINNHESNDQIGISFDMSRTLEMPDFLDRVTNCVKRLINLCGGTKEYNPLSPVSQSHDKLIEKMNLLNFLRAKIMALSPKDSWRGDYMIEASYNENNCTLTYASHSSYTYNTLRIIDFSNLDANGMVWDIFKPEHYSKSLRLTLAGKIGSGKWKEYGYGATRTTERDTEQPPFFLFDVSKAADIPNFQEMVSKAVKRLIELCGGKKEEKDPFAN